MANIRTLGDYKDKDNKPPGKRGNTTYAGGFASGIAVQHPGRGDDNEDEASWSESFLEKVKQAGIPERSQEQSQKSKGNRLGQTKSDPNKPPEVPKEEPPRVQLNIWDDGFSVDDGPLRRPGEPENDNFLAEVEKGYVPSELRRQNNEVHVSLLVRGTPYVAPPKKEVPFAGAGRAVGSSSSPLPAPIAPTLSVPATAPVPEAPVPLTQGGPDTKLSIRLADGTRLQGSFSVDATIADIRRFINSAQPSTGRPFQVITTMPRQVFDNEKATLKELGLLNAAVVQHYV